MRLLICTQKVDQNDPILGFFHTWVAKLAEGAESIEVICLEKGNLSLPSNVQVHSLGKESGQSRIKYLVNFYNLIFKLRKKYDTVFVHMNPEYVVLGGIFWKLSNKKIALWYTHREVNLKLRLAEKLSDIIFTASKESFRLKTNKLKVLGHGIDLKNFECSEYIAQNDEIKILQVGRITRIKHLESAIGAVADLKTTQNKKISLRIVGEVATAEDRVYIGELKNLIETKNVSDEVKFVGNVSSREIHKEYNDADVTLNLTPTGGVDKAVLESMASGRITLSSNQAFKEYFGQYSNELLLKDNNSESVASAIKNILDGNRVIEMTKYLKKVAFEKTDVNALIHQIVKELQ